MTTTVTLEDIAAAAGGGEFYTTDDRGKRKTAVQNALVDEEGVAERAEDHPMNCGNAEDFVIASKKRKRRIEIPRIPRVTQEMDLADSGSASTTASNAKTMVGGDKKCAKDSYLNTFCAGGMAFSANGEQDQMNGNELNSFDVPRQVCEGTAGEEETGREELTQKMIPEQQQKEHRKEIKSTADLVGGKIKFLSEGRPAVSGVQVMAIQLEVSTSYKFKILLEFESFHRIIEI